MRRIDRMTVLEKVAEVLDVPVAELAAEAYEYLRLAKEPAERVGEGPNDYDTEFGPTNVALRAAGNVDPSGLSPERQARCGVDQAGRRRRRRPGERAPDLAGAVPRQARSPGHESTAVRPDAGPGERAGGGRQLTGPPPVCPFHPVH
ncbi:hypothetical protein [Streptomyces sp. SBT349]|uniref:hypothetical protein n=1 Tax=Streptomyces sp. SBT349 TaxID=1580539 RepID=UPI000B23F935|nr:hypothetical protein [Streptomyces sp. SBT349]